MLGRTVSGYAVWMLLGGVACGAQAVPLMLPVGVAYDSAGNLFVADARRQQVLETMLSGVTVVVAGTGVQGFAGDGGVATAALLNAPSGVAVSSDGAVYIADAGNQRVRVVVGGVISTVASGLNRPVAVAVDAAGGVLIAESGNHRLRRLFGGVVTTIVGTGVQGFGGDGGLATVALLDTPMGVAVAGDGRVFVADSHNHRVRVVGLDGKIATFAGTGVRGFGGDGGAAVGAMLWLPRGVAVTAAGEVVFADSDNQRVRVVDTGGMIRTVAGSGVQGSSGDGVVAVGAALDSPRGVAVSGFGETVFGDARNRVVREVAGDADLYALMVARPVGVVLTVPVLTYGQGVVGVVVSGAAPVAQGSVGLLDGGVVVGSGMLVGGGVSLATDSLGAGPHVLTAVFAGDGVHGVSTSAAVAVSVAQAAVRVVVSVPQVSYAGLPVTLSAAVGPVVRGVPTGVVSFLDGGVMVGSGTIMNGVASAVYLAPGVGAHSITAVYGGDKNFLAGSSTVSSVTVSAMPDFSVGVSGSATQTVQGGTVASYALQVAGQPGPFSGSVSMSVSGLPVGATASFSPVSVVPGSSSVAVAMSVQTIALATRERNVGVEFAGLVMVVALMKRRLRRLLPWLAMVALISSVGCGDRTFGASARAAPQTFPITVTATSTNLLGAIVVHATSVTLVVQ